MPSRLVPLLLLAGLSAAPAGCGLAVDYYATPQLNLRYSAAANEIHAGKSPAVLEFLIFQVTKIDPEKRRLLIDKTMNDWALFGSQWESFRNKGTFPDYLKPHLSYPATLSAEDRPVEHFAIEPGRSARAQLKRPTRTSHLLVIALGAERTERSVRLINLGATEDAIALCFHEYDIFPFELGKPWPCTNFPHQSGG
jgi:hypothetical protein